MDETTRLRGSSTCTWRVAPTLTVLVVAATFVAASFQVGPMAVQHSAIDSAIQRLKEAVLERKHENDSQEEKNAQAAMAQNLGSGRPSSRIIEPNIGPNIEPGQPHSARTVSQKTEIVSSAGLQAANEAFPSALPFQNLPPSGAAAVCAGLTPELIWDLAAQSEDKASYFERLHRHTTLTGTASSSEFAGKLSLPAATFVGDSVVREISQAYQRLSPTSKVNYVSHNGGNSPHMFMFEDLAQAEEYREGLFFASTSSISRGVKDPSGAVQKRPHAAHPKVRGMTRGIPWHRETVGENA